MEKHTPADPLLIYLREVSSIDPLTDDEETTLFRELAARPTWDEQSELFARRLIENRLPLVVSLAGKYSASGVRMLDLVEEGNLGLIKAVRSFALHPTGDFASHAASCIEDALRKLVGKSR